MGLALPQLMLLGQMSHKSLYANPELFQEDIHWVPKGRKQRQASHTRVFQESSHIKLDGMPLDKTVGETRFLCCTEMS